MLPGAVRLGPEPRSDALTPRSRREGAAARVAGPTLANRRPRARPREGSSDEKATNDALAYLSAAIFLAFAAIEAYANEKIEGLAPGIEVKGRPENHRAR